MNVYDKAYKKTLQQLYKGWQDSEQSRKAVEALQIPPPVPEQQQVPERKPAKFLQAIKALDQKGQQLVNALMVGAAFKPEERAEAMAREGFAPEETDNTFTKLAYTGGDVARNLSQMAIAGQALGPLGALVSKIPGVSQLSPVVKAVGSGAAKGLAKQGVESLMSGEAPTARDLASEAAFWGAMGGTGEALRNVMPEVPTMIGRPVKTGLSALAGSLASAPITEEKETLGGMALNAGIMALFDAAGLALNPMERAMAEGQRKNALIQKKVIKPLQKFSQKLNKEVGNIAQGDPSQVVNQLTKTRDDSLNYIEHLARKNKWSTDFEQYAKNVVNSGINGTIANFNVQQATGPSIGQQATTAPIIPKGIQSPVVKTTPPIPVQASILGAGGEFPAGQGQTPAKGDEKPPTDTQEGRTDVLPEPEKVSKPIPEQAIIDNPPVEEAPATTPPAEIRPPEAPPYEEQKREPDAVRTVKGIEEGAKTVAQRIVNAENSFINTIMEMHGYSKEEAERILEVYKKEKVIKIDPVVGDYTVKHGVFTEKEVLDNALRQARGETESSPQTRDPIISKPSAYKEPFATGNTVPVKTERGTSVEARYAIVSANDLITSHDTGLSLDPRYPSELQPRDRSRIASEAQINRIVNNLEPEFLGESPKASDGAPIVGPDMIVESGNGRVIALKRIYETAHENEQTYYRWLISNTKKLGIDIDSAQRKKDFPGDPVLVRIRKSDIDRVQFVKEANEQSVAAMSATEQAMSDADKMTGAMLLNFHPTEEGEIVNPGNIQFIRRFMGELVSPAERGRYMTKDGSISQEGVNRIRNAVFAKAYGNPETIAKLAESTDTNIKNILSALLLEAPQVVQIKEEIRKGNMYPLDISTNLIEAANKISFLRERGETVRVYLMQEGLFGKDISPLAADILEIFDQYARKRKAIVQFIRNYNNGIIGAGDPKQTSLFAKGKPTKAELLLAAKKEMGDLVDTQTTLFGNQTTHGKSLASGDTKRRAVEEIEKPTDAEFGGTSGGTRQGAKISGPTHTEEQISAIIKKAGFRDIEEAQEAFYGSGLPILRKKVLDNKLAKLPQDKLEQIKFDLQYFAEAKRWKDFTPEEKDKAKKLIREMQQVSSKLKYMRPEYRDAIKAVLDEIDLPVISRRRVTVRKLASLREYVKMVPDNNVPDYLIEKAEILDKKAIRDMTLDELQEVHDTVMGLAKYEELKNILLFKQGKTEYSKVKAQAMANVKKLQLNKRDPKNIDTTDQSLAPKGAKAFFRKHENMETLSQRLDGSQKGIIYKVFYEGIDDGRDEQLGLEQQVFEMIEEGFKKAEIGDIMSFSELFNTKKKNVAYQKVMLHDGKQIRLTKGERIAFLLHSKNKDNRAHILTGGFSFKKDKGTIHNITAKDYKTIIASATAEERRIADVFSNVYNGIIKNKLNERWVELNGWEVAREENYYPIEVNRMDLDYDPMHPRNRNFSYAHLENMGIFKERTKGKNAVVITDAFETMYRHIQKTTIYYGLAKPLRNMRMLLLDKDFRQELAKADGDFSWRMLDQYVKDIEAFSTDMEYVDKLATDLMQKIDTSILAANPWVVLKQPISLILELNEMDGKYLAQAMTMKRDLEEIKKYSPQLRERIDGDISVEMGELGKVGVVRKAFTGKTPWTSRMTKGITIMDNITVGITWNAVKLEVKDKHPELPGQDFYQTVAKRTEEIIRHTQSVYDAKDRSELGRSKSLAWRMGTRFTSQRNVTYNAMSRVILDYNQSDKTAKDASALLQKLFILTVVAALAEEMVNKLRDKFYGKNDDETIWETALKVGQNTIGYTYLLGDATDMILRGVKSGSFMVDYNNPTIQLGEEVIKGTVEVINTITQAVNQDVYKSGPNKGKPKWKNTSKRAAVKAITVASRLKGLPYDNARKLAAAAWDKLTMTDEELKAEMKKAQETKDYKRYAELRQELMKRSRK